MRIIGHIELTASIVAAPEQIRITFLVEDLILQLLAIDGELDAVSGELGRLGGSHPEQIPADGVGQLDCLRIDLRLIDLHAASAGELLHIRVRHLIPALSRVHIERYDLIVGRKLIYVLLDEFTVNSGRFSLGCDVAAGIEPLLMKNLLLESAENGLNRLGWCLVRSGGTEERSDAFKPVLRVSAASAALVIGHELVRLAACEFQRIAHGFVKSLKRLGIADVAAEEYLTGCVHDFIDIQGSYLVTAVDVSLVKEVQPGTITIPKRVRHGRKDSGVLARIDHLRLGIAYHGTLPLYLYLRTGEEVYQGSLSLQRLPAMLSCFGIVFGKDLRIGIDRSPGALEGDDEATAFLGDLASIRIDQMAAYQAAVTDALIFADLVTQTGDIARQRVPILRAQLFACLVDRRPVDRRAVAMKAALDALSLLHVDKDIQH